MGPGIGPVRRFFVALIGILLLSANAVAGDPQTGNAQAIERFRAAVVLQERALYDLAAAEYAAIAREFATDPLADRACLQRGICLFQLEQYADAAAELDPLATREHNWSPAESEQSLAYLGLAKYNLSHTAAKGVRDKLLDEATDALARQLTQFPDGQLAPQTAFYHAEALYARGRLDAAAAAYRSLLTKYRTHPQRADALYALGVAEQERGVYADAVETFALFEREFSQHAANADARARHGDAFLSLAESQLAGGEPLVARRTVEKLLAEFPESALVPPALALLAQVQLGQSELAAAEAALDECIARSTHAAVTNDARLLRAQVRYQRGNFAGSRADAVGILAHDPKGVEALYLRGLCDARLGKHDDAIKAFTQLLAADPTYAHADRVLYDLAWAYQAANQQEAAIATFAKLAAAYPRSEFAAECHFRVGESRYDAKDFTAAAKCYSQVCESAPNPALLDKSLHKLAWCCFERGQFGAAEDAFNQQVVNQRRRIDPSTPLDPLAADALLMIVECRYQQHQYKLALQAFDAAAQQQSASESLRAMTGVHAAECAAETKQWERARELADRALHDFPASPYSDDARFERGNALLELGRLDDAQQDLAAVATKKQGVLQLKSELALGKIQVAKGDGDSAVRTFFKVAYGHGGPAAPASYHPWQAEAIYAAAGVLEQSGRQEAAGKLYQELVDFYPASVRTTVARESLDRNLRR